MSDLVATAKALGDPTRHRVLDLLADGPRRTQSLADETRMSSAALSRHLAVLRDAGLVERADVAGDGRGREYRLAPSAAASLTTWIEQTWAAALPRGHDPDASALLARLGAFLDAFSAGDVAFFRRHLHDDVLLVFPGLAEPVDKQGCLDSVGDHPPYQRYDIEPEPTVRSLGTHSLIFTTATVRHEQDTVDRRLAITALFTESDPWTLLHLQWTTAPDETEEIP